MPELYYLQLQKFNGTLLKPLNAVRAWVARQQSHTLPREGRAGLNLVSDSMGSMINAIYQN